MKRNLFLSIVALFVALGLSAQPTITNPGFEQWSSGAPNDWTTSISGNINYSLYGVNIPIPIALNFGTQTSDAHSGNSALKINASSLTLAQLAGVNVTIPGIAQLGTAGGFDVDWETIQALIDMDTTSMSEIDWTQLLTILNCVSHGLPFSNVPTAVNAWIKYQPAAGTTDTMMVIAAAYKEGELMGLFDGVTMPTGYAFYSNAQRYDEYTQIHVEMNYLEDNIDCDSLALIFVSSSMMNAQESTSLFIDDITFEFNYGTAIKDVHKADFVVYPNPSAEYINIQPINDAEEYNVVIVDQNGRTVQSLTALTGVTKVGVSELAAGLYFAKVLQGGQQCVRNFVVK